jgi:hypothetical protein
MKKVIIGPTFYAAGQALQADNDVLVIGRNSSIGDEWSYSYRQIDSTPFMPDSEITLDLLTELSGLSLTSPEENALAVSVMLYKFLEKIPEKFKLWTEIELIKEVEDGYELTLYTVSGREVIQCGELIDNTPDARTCPDWGQSNIQAKRLNMVVSNCGDDSELVSEFSELTIRAGRTEKEAVVEYKVDPKAAMMEARKQLLELWQQRPEKMRNWKIASFGAEFDYDLSCDIYDIQPNWKFINPLAFASPAAAFDAGLTGGGC